MRGSTTCTSRNQNWQKKKNSSQLQTTLNKARTVKNHRPKQSNGLQLLSYRRQGPVPTLLINQRQDRTFIWSTISSTFTPPLLKIRSFLTFQITHMYAIQIRIKHSFCLLIKISISIDKYLSRIWSITKNIWYKFFFFK
jgi:hypothetical protein